MTKMNMGIVGILLICGLIASILGFIILLIMGIQLGNSSLEWSIVVEMKKTALLIMTIFMGMTIGYFIHTIEKRCA